MKSVLVVDDDPEVLQYTVSTLTRGGIPAISAQSAEEAMRIFERRKREIHLLLTDIVMPRTTGIILATEIAALEPKMPIIFMTGYMTDHLGQFGPALQGKPILGKPFTPAELLRVVSAVIHHRK